MNLSLLNKIENPKEDEEFSMGNIEIQKIEKENFLKEKNIENGQSILLDEQKNISSLELKNKKRGRKKDGAKIKIEKTGIHDKFSDDNIKRKVKTHFHNFIIAFLNLILDKTFTKRKFGKISSYITQNITVGFNQKLFEQPIKDIVVQMSNKYQDKEKNMEILNYIFASKREDDELIKILNMKYKDFYLNYYLKSTKNIFEGEPEDESYEGHVNKMERIYGNFYVNKYKKNAESLISFFNKCKKRIRKKKFTKLINPLPFLNSFNKGINEHFYYNENNLFPFSKLMISTSTQTNSILIEDDD